MRSFLKILANLALYLVIVGVLVWGLPKFLAWQLGTTYPIAAITSGSMWPVLKTGDMIFIKKVSREEIAVGDVVVWSAKGSFTIHRVKELKKDALVTRGDANSVDDAPVPYDAVIGRALRVGDTYLRIPFVGYVAIWAGSLRPRAG